MTKFTYEHFCYLGKNGEDLPAFEILDKTSERVAVTNEYLPILQQEEIAKLFCSAPRLLETLKMAGGCFGQANLLSTATDEERREALGRFFDWWNNVAVYAIAEAKEG